MHGACRSRPGLKLAWPRSRSSAGEGNVRVPTSPADFDPMLASSPSLQALVDNPRYRSGDTWIACPFRAAAAQAHMAATGAQIAGETMQRMVIRSISTASVPRPRNARSFSTGIARTGSRLCLPAYCDNSTPSSNGRDTAAG